MTHRWRRQADRNGESEGEQQTLAVHVRKFLYGSTREEVAEKLEQLLNQQQGVNIDPERLYLKPRVGHHQLSKLTAVHVQPETQRDATSKALAGASARSDERGMLHA
jgi:hypothetical protein